MILQFKDWRCSPLYDVSEIEVKVSQCDNLCYDNLCCEPFAFFFTAAVHGCSVNRPNDCTNDGLFNDNPTLELAKILQEPRCLLRGQHFIALFAVCQTSLSMYYKEDFMVSHKFQFHPIKLLMKKITWRVAHCNNIICINLISKI